MTDTFTKALAVATGVLSTTRAVRLVIDDDYPPVLAFKRWFVTKVGGEPWADIVDCPWCCAPYIAAPATLWGAITYASDNKVNRWAWWLVNGWSALSFAAAYISLRDIPAESRS